MLKINGVDFWIPKKGSYSETYKNMTNENVSDSGTTTVQTIRENILSISISYPGLFEEDYTRMKNALTSVCTVSGNGITERQMKLTDISRNKIIKNTVRDANIYSLSFGLEEL